MKIHNAILRQINIAGRKMKKVFFNAEMTSFLEKAQDLSFNKTNSLLKSRKCQMIN